MTDRIRGRKLQQRRLSVWSRDPHCARCRRLVAYPNGFELDHIRSLDAGGPDTEDNTQVLCSGEDGCHRKKTAEDMGHQLKGCDASGMPADPNHHWR
jgi:5-methylcytosine-specific restriction protein A